ncbi:MAG TPA: metallophosphoesterase [Gammaproteobacteria bacterium]|nr:metallophosphoesterase [Gammaproteobacteria bacterium]
MKGYDIIGDIHGREDELRGLLVNLGYGDDGGVWRHPDRQALFIGDFIDRYPARGVLDIVRPMVENGTALAVMGNHELNAIAYHYPDPDSEGDYLRPRNEKNRGQHAAFRHEFEPEPAVLDDTIDWFRTLPLWLDLGELRAVHAAWHEPSMARLRRYMDADGRLTDAGIINVHQRDSDAADAVEVVAKGVEFELPDGASFFDKGKVERHNVRVKWWRNQRPAKWADVAIGPPNMQRQLPEATVDWPADLGYPADAPPVFIGHYWWSGPPAPLAPNVACVDYSAGLAGGKLVAYRWSGESRLSERNFVAVPRGDE